MYQIEFYHAAARRVRIAAARSARRVRDGNKVHAVDAEDRRALTRQVIDDVLRQECSIAGVPYRWAREKVTG